MNVTPFTHKPEDRTFINLGDELDVRFWCGRFGCTAAQLKAAVAAVGPLVKDVSRWFHSVASLTML